MPDLTAQEVAESASLLAEQDVGGVGGRSSRSTGSRPAVPVQGRLRSPRRNRAAAGLVGNRVRHRLSRTGNRQLNAAIHRIAITQMRIHEPAKTYLERRIAMGNTKTEALRALKRKLSDAVYRALLADATTTKPALEQAA